ncbi:MAG: hypothetical protein N2253_00090 [Bacteroidia bacterium]|nr:hypothetical protein [Bacteroidia bacterium]MCX7763282.1 hypothetical protein [Bacteroidia bacterium]MDW8058168.1 hypothetical protein [Bacteroidia bacterium]
MSFRVSYQAPPLPQRGEADGLPVYWLPSKEPLAQVGFIWEAPALKEYDPGIRRLLLRLLSEENQLHPEGKLRQQLHRLGWDYSWDADRDNIYLFGEGLRENLSSAIKLLYASVAYPVLSGPLVKHHLHRLVEGERRARANPAYRADALLSQHLWGSTYTLTRSVPLERLEGMDTAQLRAYHERFLLRGLQKAIISAPFLPSELRAWAEFHGKVAYALPVVLSPSLICETVAMEAAQVSLRIAYPWVRPFHPQFGYYRMAALRLGGYFGAQLMQSIREEAGLTYGIYARPDSCHAGSALIISTEVAKNRAAEAVARIQTEVERWSQNPFPTEEILLETRNYLLLQIMPETLSEWTQRLMRLYGIGLEPDRFIQQNKLIDSLQALEEVPRLELPSLPYVQIGVGTDEPIFASTCA